KEANDPQRTLPDAIAFAARKSARDDLHVWEAGLLPDDRIVERFHARAAHDHPHEPAGRAADLGARRIGNRVPRARRSRWAVPAVVAAQGGVHRTAAEPSADPNSRGSAQRSASDADATAANPTGQADPADDEQRVRRDVAYRLAGVALTAWTAWPAVQYRFRLRCSCLSGGDVMVRHHRGEHLCTSSERRVGVDGR